MRPDAEADVAAWGLDDEEEEEDDWACPTLAEIEADLAECEAAAASADSRIDEEELRSLLRQRSDAEVFFSMDRALKGIAGELQGVLVQAETLQLDAAALAASIAGGPLKPPEASRGAPSARRPSALDLFGSAAAAQAAIPSSLQPAAPAAAAELSSASGVGGAGAGSAGGAGDLREEYKRLLAGFPPELVVRRSLRLCVGDVNQYQDKKDIGRDQLIVNGRLISGAQGGYAAAVGAIAASLGEASRWAEGSADRAARLLLSVLNRTSSGFTAFEEVLRLYDCQDAVIVSPESAQARPLELSVLEGVALGRAHTRYAVRLPDGSGEPLLVVDAVFVFRVETSALRQLAADKAGGEDPDSWPASTVPALVLLSRSAGAA
eukprot:TRINITY_DN22859_c0_g4_i1.p1 TRINITY_DN22859_c0_g4~~TRINITY_DN22859_c0_g4_i1.p1  ORF type:complete len:378 (+),score=108.83 TRINITY_DN22859_c0_g4_i1:64-1197(+)